MMWLKKYFGIFFIVGYTVLAFDTVTYAQTQPLQDSMALIAPISNRIAQEVPKHSLRRISGVMQVGKSSLKAEHYYERLESGLWNVAQIVHGQNIFIKRAQTVKGLIPLTGLNNTELKYETNSVIPIEKIFFHTEQENQLTAFAATTTVSLDANFEQLISPLENSKFSFDYSWDAKSTITTTGMFGGTKTRSSKNHMSQQCVTGKSEDASILHQQFQGKYIPVSCERKQKNGSNDIAEYAYLIDSSIYIILSATNSSGSEKLIISEVTYLK